MALFVAHSSSAAQELSTLVFPSEDEISEALELGLIDSTEAAALIETVQLGIEPGSYHRYDLIPNLSYLYSDNADLYDMIRLDQKSFIGSLHSGSSRISGELWYETYQEVNEANRTRYRTGFSIFADEHWQVGARVNREYSGAERFTDRKLSYINKNGAVKEIILGSFSRRYGLGSLIGYRGKLFDYSEEIDNESLLYPDYGGFNGFHAEIGTNRINSMTLVSTQRDADYRLQTYGEFITYDFARLRVGLLGVVNHLNNRLSEKTFDDLKLGFFGYHDYRKGKLAIETSLQQGERQSFGALVIEGRHNFDNSRFIYSLWHYDDQFVDLSSGSKSANIRHGDSLDESGFNLRTRRSGQSGLLVKNVIPVSKETRLSNSVLSAWLNSDTVLIEMISAAEHDLSSEVSLRVDYTNHYRKNVSSDKIEQISRAELRIISGNYRLRTYIGINRKADGTDYLLLFGTADIKRGRFGRWRVWTDLRRVNIDDGSLDYAYTYVEHIREIESWLKGRVKISERYNRAASEKYLTTLSFELTVLI